MFARHNQSNNICLMKRRIGVNVHFCHQFDIERRYMERCWFWLKIRKKGVHQRKLMFNVFFHKYFLNDYMKHIIETNLQINGQKHLAKISELFTYFHNFGITFLKGQKFKMSVDFVTKKSLWNSNNVLKKLYSKPSSTTYLSNQLKQCIC